MSQFKWSKFWWDDYEHDPRLKLCSFAAQGLWMRMLCIMHRATPRGYLHIDGDPITVAQLAGLSGKKIKETAKLFQELREKKVFSVSENGVAFSRKMVEETKKTEDSIRFGREGGNPQITKKPKGGVNPTHNFQEEEKKRRREEEIDSGATHLPPAGAVGDVPTTGKDGLLGDLAPRSPPPPPDAKALLFGWGLDTLRAMTGRSEGSVRSWMGQMLKVLHDDAAVLNTIIQQAVDERPADPTTWLSGAVRHRAGIGRSGKPEAFGHIAETPESELVRRVLAGEIDESGREIRPSAARRDDGFRGTTIDGEAA